MRFLFCLVVLLCARCSLAGWFKSNGYATVIETVKGTGQRLSESTIYFDDYKDNDVTITIDPRKTYQQILGFGGAITEASTMVLNQLPTSVQDQVMELYYGRTGNRYSTVRIHMNSCDFSLSSYSYSEVNEDWNLDHFDSTVLHDQYTLIPYLRRALATSKGALRIFFSPWSPPYWMKSSWSMVGSNSPGLKDDWRVHRAWALYFSKFIDAYKKQGIDFWGFTVQNEPEYAAPWEACVYTAEQQRDFIRDHLGPIMNASHPEVKMMIFDHNKDHIYDWAKIIYSDSQASQYVWGTAFHWYSGDQFDHLQATHEAFPDKHLFASESCNCPGVLIDDWARAEAYAHDIIGDLNHWATGWTDWNIVLNSDGGPNHLFNNCDSPIIANVTSGTIHLQPTYYFLGHFSRFFPPASERVEVSVKGSKNLPEVTCFLTPSVSLSSLSAFSKPTDASNESSITCTVLNRLEAKIDISMLVADKEERLSLSIQPRSITTVIFHPDTRAREHYVMQTISRQFFRHV